MRDIVYRRFKGVIVELVPIKILHVGWWFIVAPAGSRRCDNMIEHCGLLTQSMAMFVTLELKFMGLRLFMSTQCNLAMSAISNTIATSVQVSM